MSEADLIQIPGYPPGTYARRILADALAEAGSPPANSITRLYAEQKELHDDYLSGDGAPADDPDASWLPLVHVRGVGADIDPTPDRIARLEAAGLVRPYWYEPWHWQPAGDMTRFELVTAFPTPKQPAPKPTPKKEDDEMTTSYINMKGEPNKRRGGCYAIMRDNAGKLFAKFASATPLDGVPTITGDREIAEWQKTMPGFQ